MRESFSVTVSVEHGETPEIAFDLGREIVEAQRRRNQAKRGKAVAA
jgi:hypothetical protein